MKNFRQYIDIVKEEQVSEAARKKVADKVMRQVVGPTPAARLAAELPTSKAIINGQTWERVGNNMYNRQTNKVLGPEEFNKLRSSSGQGSTTGTSTTTGTSSTSPNYRQGNYGQTNYNAPTTVPRPGSAPTVPRTGTTTGPGTVTGTVPRARLAQRGSAIKRFVQRNPKLAAALGIVTGVAAYKAGTAAYDYFTGDKEEETPSGPVTPVTPAPAPAPAPAPEQRSQSGKPEEPTAEQKWQAESDKLKAEIDALFKELEPVKDVPVPDELKRLRNKYQGSAQGGNASQSRSVSQSGKPAEGEFPSWDQVYSSSGVQNRRQAERQADAAQKKT